MFAAKTTGESAIVIKFDVFTTDCHPSTDELNAALFLPTTNVAVTRTVKCFG
jgi:hypothetical protein